jgi:hypothetical protein
MGKRFVYEFEDTSPRSLRIDYDDTDDEVLRVQVSPDFGVMLTVNQHGAMVLARILAQYATCDFQDGFHLHLNEDFDAAKAEILLLSFQADE